MKLLEEAVRSIQKDGLLWGASKLVPVGYGIKKLQINLVIEDDKIGLGDLEEEIAEFEDYVQSTDIVSCLTLRLFNLADPLYSLLCKSCKPLVSSPDICTCCILYVMPLLAGFWLPVNKIGFMT